MQNAIALGECRSATYNILGNAQFKSRDLSGAIASYEKAIALDSNQPFAIYRRLGDAYSQEGNTEKAIAAYREALKIKPDNKAVSHSLEKLKLRK